MTQQKLIKIDLLDIEKGPPTCHPYFHEWVEQKRNTLFLTNVRAWDEKTLQWIKSIPNASVSQKVAYDIKIRPQFYLKFMLKMNTEIELKGGKQLITTPLRTSNVPSHITIDTKVLYTIFVGLNSFMFCREKIVISLWLLI